MSVKYEIRKGKTEPCELVSVVKGKSWGGLVDSTFVNFVCDGTYTHCKEIMGKLEDMT